jgi:tetratricopeptide (TPR) repeat protein
MPIVKPLRRKLARSAASCLAAGLAALALMSPSPLLKAAAAGLLASAAVLHWLPLLTLPQARRSRRMSRLKRWPQAYFYAVLALDRLRHQPWRAGLPLGPSGAAPAKRLELQAECGRLLLLLRRPGEAERTLRELLRELPHEDGLAQHRLARALHAQGKLRQARAALGRALRAGYRQRQALPELVDPAGFYQALGYHAEALRLLRSDRLPAACWRRVRSLLALGRRGDAEREVWRALGEDPSNSHAWLSHGFLLAQSGSYAEATRAYTKACRLNPANLPAREQLLLLETRLCGSPGQLRGALAVLQEQQGDPIVASFGKALIHAGLECWQTALQHACLIQPCWPSLSLLEVMAYANLGLGRIRLGCRLLYRFCLALEVSGMPALHREQRLRQARLALRFYTDAKGRSSDATLP